jgi:hypothetical protein
MKSKRQALIDWFTLILKEFGDVKIEQRLRKATWDARSRQERVEIMGDPTFYCEVLWTGVGQGNQLDAVGDSILDGHEFLINLWVEYKDSPIYDTSSQKIFDDLCEGEGGLLTTIRDSHQVPNEDEFYYLYEPEAVSLSEVALDREGNELAHFLTFRLSVR